MYCRASIFVSSSLLDEAELDQVVADARAVLLLLLERLVELLSGDQPLTEEEVAKPSLEAAGAVKNAYPSCMAFRVPWAARSAFV